MKLPIIWITNDAVHIKMEDGREGVEYFNNYKRLRNATKEQLEDFTADSLGIHWNALNEDLCYDGFFYDKSQSDLCKLFTLFPEINVSAFSRRLGISQSLMAQYISGAKKPSDERKLQISHELHLLGKRLLDI